MNSQLFITYSSQKAFRQRYGASMPLLALCLVGMAPAWSQARFKSDVMRNFGGVYASSCGAANGPKLRVAWDALVLEHGDKRIVGRNVQADPAYAKAAQLPHFQVALTSTLRSGAKLDFVVLEEKSIVNITLQADPGLQEMLGKSVLAAKYHRCSNDKPGNKAEELAADNGEGPQNTLAEPMSDTEKMLLDPQFKAAYTLALGPLARDRWLARLEGPRPPMRREQIAGTEYVVIAVCKPHFCTDYNAALLYAPAQRQLYGKVHQLGNSTLLGTPPPAVQTRLDAVWADQWQQH
jgi:hypothetical protein